MGMSNDPKAMLKSGLTTAEMASRAGEVANLLKTLSHPARLMIVCTLVEREYSVGALEEKLDIHQPHLSQHLTVLRGSGIVETSREDRKSVVWGKRVSVRVDPGGRRILKKKN